MYLQDDCNFSGTERLTVEGIENVAQLALGSEGAVIVNKHVSSNLLAHWNNTRQRSNDLRTAFVLLLKCL